MIKAMIKAHWPSVSMAIISVFGVSFMTLLLPVLLGTGDMIGRSIWQVTVIYIVMFAFASAFRVGSFALLSNHVSDYLLTQGLYAIFSHPREHPEIDYRQLKTDVDKITAVCEQSLSQFLRNLILIIGGFGMMINTSGLLSGMILIFLPMGLLPVFFLRKGYRSVLFELTSQEAVSENTRSSYMQYVDQIWHYQNENWALDRISDQINSMRSLRRRKLIYRILLSFLVITLVLMALAAIAYVALEGDVSSSQMATGEVLQFAVSAFLVAIAMSGMSELQHQILSMKMAFGRIDELLQHRKQRSMVVGDEIKVSHVFFKYENKVILDDFNIQIGRGEKIAVVGSSGVGKSTLLKILLGQLDADQGHLHYQIRQCAYLMGEVPLLLGSILDNLTLGAKCSIPAIQKGIRAMGLDDSIGQLPLDEIMPDVSAGQKQRVDLLRAIFQDKPILILDEPTSHLDFNLQAKINDYLCQQERTVVISSHQLAFIQRADRVVFLSDQGGYEIGAHESLLSQSEAYQRFMKEINDEKDAS